MPETPEQDPVVTKSLSVPLMVSTLLLMVTLVWAVYDEVYALRPWKGFQVRFVDRYTEFLTNLSPRQAQAEQEVKASSRYQTLDAAVQEAETAVAEQIGAIDRQVNQGVTPRMIAARQAFQVLRSEADALTYQLETSTSESAKASLQADIDAIRQREVEVDLILADGSGQTETVAMNYAQLEEEYLGLQRRRAEMQAERARLNEPATEARQARDAYLQEQLFGLTEQQVAGLINGMENFSIEIKQIHLSDIDLVDRCESCHLGVRQPVEISREALGEATFMSHPSPDLLALHDPEQFGCTSCHNGNGRATSSVEKGHGRYRHWLWPLHEPENVTAGCQQCHSTEVVTEHAGTLNEGRELFLNKGCWGCHRFEGFDRESDELAAIRQQIGVLRDQLAANEKEGRRQLQLGDAAPDNDTAQRYYARTEQLSLRNSRLDAELDALVLEERNLQAEVRKFGPSLKEIQVKLRKEWVPVWLRNPHEFRPGTKMPAFRLLDEEIESISAYIWQNAISGDLEQHPQGNATRGQELFETRGCLGCHSIGEGDERLGGDFAANLSRVGEKTNYNFLVRWIHDPSELTPSPTGEGEIRPIPLMPNLRLSFDDARDIASYLTTQSTDATYPPAPFMDDPQRAEEGLTLIRHYGCAGCHEISGLEEEGRIGTELTTEGSKPIERLDFALLTHEAEHDGWYTHKGFFEHKLENPAVFDQGKVKPHLEQLRMPNFNLNEEQIQALATFLLGAVDSTFPPSYRYEPEDQRRDAQEGWWVVQRYNCRGCHQILPGDVSSFMTMPRYEDPDWVEQMPPQLFTEGARVQPNWLLSFLENPAMSETDIHRNGVREYLHARMPTFQFTDRQISKLMRFFMARSSQPLPYIPAELATLTTNEAALARALFTSRDAPCLRCHATGDAAHDATATAPNFLLSSERLKPDWTYRWMLDPARISPGTAMPSGLFRQEGGRWVFNGQLPAAFANYEGDHARLLVRYMFQFTPQELQRLRASGVQ